MHGAGSGGCDLPRVHPLSRMEEAGCSVVVQRSQPPHQVRRAAVLVAAAALVLVLVAVIATGATSSRTALGTWAVSDALNDKFLQVLHSQTYSM